MTEDELKAARAAKAESAIGRPSTRRRDAALLAAGKVVPRPTMTDLETLVREIDAEVGQSTEAVEAAAASVVVALRARGWTFQMIAERMGQPEERVRAWLAVGIDADMVAETETFLDKFAVPAAADLAYRAVLDGDTGMAKELLRGRGPLRKVLKEPGPKGASGVGATGQDAGPPVLNLQINVLPGTPGATVAVGSVVGVPRLPKPEPVPADEAPPVVVPTGEPRA
ncbi:MAG: hypothetical protein IT519_11545 [Burkholderiales bacterium]|nr:hypothetical protein [Burkholderiales bacterium]